jgi:Probable zinc-ribbon domain
MTAQIADQTLQCSDCKKPFIFTAGEQAFFTEKGFAPPRRCKGCRDIRKQNKLAAGPTAAPVQAQPAPMPARRGTYVHEEGFGGGGGGDTGRGRDKGERGRRRNRDHDQY